MCQKVGRPDWWRVGRDFHMIARKSRTSRWELTVPSSRALIEAKDSLFSAPFPPRYRIDCNAQKSKNPDPRLGPRRRVSRVGGGPSEIPHGRPDIAQLAATMVQKEGRPDWRRIVQDFPRIARKSRTNRWELTVTSFWTLIADMDSLFPDPPPVRYRTN